MASTTRKPGATPIPPLPANLAPRIMTHDQRAKKPDEVPDELKLSTKTEAQVSLWEILVPHKMGPNARRVIPVPYHQQWDAKVREIAGGLTIMKVAKGQWVNKEQGGKVYKELMIPVRIAATRSQMLQIADFTVLHYKQWSVMFYKVTDEVVFRQGRAKTIHPCGNVDWELYTEGNT